MQKGGPVARRSVPADPSIGRRVRSRRRLRGWSIRFAADRAGVAHTTWSRIERGELRTDRYMIADLAAALECSVTDLTGQPYQPADRRLEAAQIEAERVWQAMMAHPLSEPVAGEAPPADSLAEEANLASEQYARCDYAGTLRIARALVPGLHAAQDRPETPELMVTVYGVTMGALLNIGYPAYGWLAAERCADAACLRDAAVPQAVAAVNRARVLAYSGAYSPAAQVCGRAAAELELDLSAPAALDLLGFTHLARAHHHAGLHERDVADDHLAEAGRIAERTGETAAWDLAWGPRNVALWRMAYLLDTQRPGEALEVATAIRPSGLPPVRQVYFYLDMARALTELRRGDEAVRMLLAGERIGPQHIRSSVAGRETARTLLHRGVGGAELRGLCERMGIAA